jgi:hypothetical protein
MTEITLDMLMPGLNGAKGLIREHFTMKKSRATKLSWIIRAQLGKKLVKYQGPVRITYKRYSTKLMDWDNHCASFKTLGDVLVSIGIIEDDNPNIIVEFVPLQEKVKTRKEHKTVVMIESLAKE